MKQSGSIEDQDFVREDHHRPGPKSLVCENCWNEVFDTDVYETVCLNDDYIFEYTRSYQDIQHAALAECSWCMFIMSELVKSNAPKTQVTVKFTGIDDPFSKVVTPKGQNTYHLSIKVGGKFWEVHLFAYAHATDPAAKFVTARKLQPNVSSDSAIKQCQEWLDDCTSSHEQCRKPAASQLPTRVVDVSPTECSDKPRVLETRGKIDEYLTLSYCWGKQQPDGLLTSQNVAAYYEQLDISAMSHTFRDAIDLTKRLGFRFIWIDALCILQDSEWDKEKEFSCMRTIYRDSVLTIVASSASGVEEGFLADRSNEDLGVLMNKQLIDRGVRTNPSDIPSPSSTYEIPFRYNHGCMGCMSIRTDHYSEDLLEPVNRRAWTFQEQLLAPRLLLYSSHTLQWRCQSRSRNLDDSLHVKLYQYALVQPLEGNEYQLPLRADHEKDGDTKQRREPEIWSHWNNVLYQYSTRQASLPEDKLVALGGVAEGFSRLINSRYLAGLWENRLCEQLLWETLGEVSCPAQYRAPSWSWAAIDGPVMSMEIRKEKRKSIAAEVVECNVVLKSQMLPFGAVKDGFIKLRAVRRPGRPCFFNKNPFIIWEDNKMWKIDDDKFTKETAQAFPRVHLDGLGPISKEEVECMVVLESSSGDELDGLLLQHSGVGLYRRIGLFHRVKKAAFEHIKQEVFTII